MTNPLHPIDLWLPLREAWVAHLKEFAPLTALVSASKIHGEQPPAKPAWPFVRLGTAVSTGFAATGWRGSTHRLTTHAFAKGPYTDAVAHIAEQILAASDTFKMDNYDIVDMQWAGTNVIRDTAEADAYHAICDFDVTAVLVTV